MRRLFLATSAFVLFIGAQALIAPRALADDSAALPRFGSVAPQSRSMLDQPMLDRYANDFAQRFATAAGVQMVPLSFPERGSASRDMCRDRQLVEFIEPHRHWHVGSNTIQIQTSFVIRDCDGNVYYTGESYRMEPHFTGALPQTQIDDTSSAALDDLLAKFAEFQRTHLPSWDQMLQTGPHRS